MVSHGVILGLKTVQAADNLQDIPLHAAFTIHCLLLINLHYRRYKLLCQYVGQVPKSCFCRFYQFFALLASFILVLHNCALPVINYRAHPAPQQQLIMEDRPGIVIEQTDC